MQYILETLGKVGFEWQMGLFNLINFLIIFFILKKYAFGPIQAVLRDREEKTKDAVENYQKSKSAVSMAEQKVQEIIDEAKVEANKLREQGTEDAKVIAERMKDKARKEIELLINQAKRNIEIDRADMQDKLRAETIALIGQAVERIIDEKMDPKKEEAYIQKIMASVHA